MIEKGERQVGKRESRPGSREIRIAVEATGARHRCDGNFQWLKGGVEIGAGGDSEWKERERERKSANE